MKIPLLLLLLACTCACATYEPAELPPATPGAQLAQNLLKSMRDGDTVAAAGHLQSLAALDPNRLAAELDTRDEQLAFWINVYNGMSQYFLVTDPGLWEDRGKFFSGERFTVAGEELSLEDVEHGIIRGGEAKLGLGYLPQIFTDKFQRTFKIDKGDPRIHFALNCGAVDCPPVEIYDAETVDERLDFRTRTYLRKTSEVDEAEETVTVTPLMNWFKGDFRTYGGLDDFLVEFGVLTEDQKDYDRDYHEYDWTLATSVYAED